MKRFMILSAMVLAIAGLTGCGGTDDAGGGDAESTGAPLELQNREGPASVEEKLEDTLESMTAEANRLEAGHEFEAAAEMWDRIGHQLTQTFGDEAWQTASPRYNAYLARQQAAFDDAQKQQLARLDQLKQLAGSPNTSGPVEVITALEEMIAIAQQLFGEKEPVVGRMKCSLAGIKQTSGDIDGAISDYHAGIDILREQFRKVHPEIVAAQSALATCYLEQQEFRTAIANLKSSTAMAGELFGEDSLQYARQANQLGVAYYQGGDLDTAETILMGAEAIRRQSLGDEHVLVAHSLLNLGIVLLDQRDFGGSAGCLERAETILANETPSGELHTKARNKLSTVYMLMRQPELAEPILKTLVEERQQELGADHPQVATLEYRYGIALARQGKYELAEPVFVRTMETQEQQLGLKNRETIKTIQAYAMLLARTGRETEARQQADRIIRVASRPESGDSPLR